MKWYVNYFVPEYWYGNGPYKRISSIITVRKVHFETFPTYNTQRLELILVLQPPTLGRRIISVHLPTSVIVTLRILGQDDER